MIHEKAFRCRVQKQQWCRAALPVSKGWSHTPKQAATALSLAALDHVLLHHSHGESQGAPDPPTLPSLHLGIDLLHS